MIARILLLSVIVFALCGCQSRKQLSDFSVPSFSLESASASRAVATRSATLPQSGTTIQLFENPVLLTGDIARVDLVEVELGLALRFTLTGTGERKLTRLSVSNRGYRLVLFILDEPIGARQIDGVLDQGVLFTFVEVPDEELPQLVDDINLALIEASKRGEW